MSPSKDLEERYKEVDAQTRQDLIDWMQRYDQDTFARATLPPYTDQAKDPSIPAGSYDSKAIDLTASTPSISTAEQSVPQSMISSTTLSGIYSRDRSTSIKASETASLRSQSSDLNLKLTKSNANAAPSKRGAMPRQFSLGPKGLGMMKGTASTSLSVSPAVVSNVTSTAVKSAPEKKPVGSRILSQQLRNTLQRKSSQQSLNKTGTITEEEAKSHKTQPSNPIKIKEASGELDGKEDPARSATVKPGTVVRASTVVPPSRLDKDSRQNTHGTLAGSLKDANGFPRTLSPLTAMSPWLTLLNPSNPRKENMNVASQYRRWQHVFPRAIPTSAIKWKSLCSPAALPLTSEFFPTAEDLAEEYIEKSYMVEVMKDEAAELCPSRDALLRELVGSRLSNGFQIVTGRDAGDFAASHRYKLLDLFDANTSTDDGSVVLMSIGNNFHQLLCRAGDRVEVKRFVRKPSKAVESEGIVDPSVIYQPRIRTMLGGRVRETASHIPESSVQL